MWKGIIDLAHPAATPAAAQLLAWETRTLHAAVVDVFGYHAVQLGMPHLQALAANRMPHQWLAMRSAEVQDAAAWSPDLCMDFSALPFGDNCLDLVVLPHTLESDPNPHGVLREVARVLVPGGRVVISGLNPTSLWSWRVVSQLPEHKIGYWRLRDWLRLLDFEIVQGDFGMFSPPVAAEKWLARWRWAERIGPRTMPMLGAAYVVTGIKQVRGMRLMGQPWRAAKPVKAQTATATQRETRRQEGQM